MIDLRPSRINGYYCPADPGEPGPLHDRRLSVNDQEARIMALFTAGKNALEIGTGLGVATRAIAASAARLVTVDIDAWAQENVFPDLRAAGVTCLDSLDGLAAASFDVAFIDGCHQYESVAADLDEVRRLVRPGGVLLFHDDKLIGVYQALQESRLEWVHIETVAGIGLAWNE